MGGSQSRTCKRFSQIRAVLQPAVINPKSLSLVLWLLAEKGADPNLGPRDGDVAVFGYRVPSFDILDALLRYTMQIPPPYPV